jgi:Zn-dependent peptidase ImmA (M78 family)/transcriptional regulator with XRE-family HTH domain
MSKLIGTRIKEAREAMGLSVNALANLIGVTRTMIYEYENGAKQPLPDKFTKLCDKLEQVPNFFYLPEFETDYSHESAHYRSLKSLKPEDIYEVSTKFKWSLEYFSLIDKKVSIPKLNFPDVHPPSDPTAITQDFIEKAATEVRKYWGLGDSPIPNLVRVAEVNGLVVARVPLDVAGMDGMSFWSAKYNRPFILLNSDKVNCVRSRFDLAHEIGHMILHRNMHKPADRGTTVYEKVERQAHFFAAALLMPRHSWLKDIEEFTLTMFRFLKPKWRTSIIAQIMHAEALGEIDQDRKRSLLKQMSTKHWRQREPFDDQWEPEQPVLFKQVTELIASKNFGIQSILQNYPHRIGVISNLTGLPTAFFEMNALGVTLKSNDVQNELKN